MKSIKKVIGLLSVFIFTIVFSVACSCGQKEVTDLAIKNGTLKMVYLQNEECTFDDLVVVATYNDGSKVEVKKADGLQISSFSTATVGTFKVTITYENKSIDVNLRVTNNQDEVYTFDGFELPQSMVDYQSNKGEKEADAKETEFYEKDKEYVVGDDNAFHFFPNITLLDDNDDEVVVNSYRSLSKVYLKDDGSDHYELLEGDDITQYVAIDEYNSNYDFTTAAIGKTFKLEVRPYYLSEDQLLEESDWTISITFKVVDGYNIDDPKELGVLNNVPTGGLYNQWHTFLTNNGVESPDYNDFNGIVLHKNLTITTSDIPSDFIENGALKDSVSNNSGSNTDIYFHQTAKDAVFNVYGNYFTVDARQIPLVADPSEGVSHSTLFKFSAAAEGGNVVLDSSLNNTHTNIYDIAIIGNGPRANEDFGFRSLIGMKLSNQLITLNNSIIRTFYINSMIEYASTYVTFNKVKSYDAYQCLVQLWGGHFTINESELKRAGGPVLLIQHPLDYSDEATIDLIPEVTVDSTTILESFVTGREAWFSKLGQDGLATKIIGMNRSLSNAANLNSKNASFTQKVNDAQGQPADLINLVAINMNNGTSPKPGVSAEGITKIGDVTTINLNNAGHANANPLIQYIRGVMAQGSGVLSAGGVYGWLVTQDRVNPDPDYQIIKLDAQGTHMDSLAGEHPEFADAMLYSEDAKYLGLYFNGLGVTLGYYHNPVA